MLGPVWHCLFALSAATVSSVVSLCVRESLASSLARSDMRACTLPFVYLKHVAGVAMRAHYWHEPKRARALARSHANLSPAVTVYGIVSNCSGIRRVADVVAPIPAPLFPGPRRFRPGFLDPPAAQPSIPSIADCCSANTSARNIVPSCYTSSTRRVCTYRVSVFILQGHEDLGR